MKENLLEFLACPDCNDASIELETVETEGDRDYLGQIDL